MSRLSITTNVLAVGAHPDDIELGCGGALLAHRRAGHSITMLVMTDGDGAGSPAIRRHEQATVARRLDANLLWGGFRDGEVPSGRATVNVIDEAVRASDAHIIYTHTANDAHQDHRHVAHACIAAARTTPTVYCYETPSTLNFAPTVFVALSDLLAAKIELVGLHSSQVNRQGCVDLEVLNALAKVRGHHARLGFAEGFESPRSQFVISAPTAKETLHHPALHAEA